MGAYMTWNQQLSPLRYQESVDFNTTRKCSCKQESPPAGYLNECRHTVFSHLLQWIWLEVNALGRLYYWRKPGGHIDLASQHTPLVRCFSCVDSVWFILRDNWDVWGTPAQSKQDHYCARWGTVFWSVLVLSSECIRRPFDSIALTPVF